MSDELDDELTRMLQYHIDNHGKTQLGGVNPPDAEQAAEGTWRGDASGMEMPEMDIRPEAQESARPGSVPAQVGAAVAGAAPVRKVDLSQPLGYRPSAKDTELAGLQADAKKRRSEAALGQAVTDFTERPTNFLDYAQRLGGGGASAAPAKNETWKNHAAEGERAIADLGARRASDARMGAAQTSAASSAEETDPSSSTSQAWRTVLTKLAPDLAERLKTASASQMKQIAPHLEKIVAQQEEAARSQAAAEAKAVQERKRDLEKGAALDLAKTNRAEDVADRRANTAATQELARASFGIRKDEVAKKADDDINDDVQKLGKELPGDVADFNAKAALIEAAMAKSPDDIPGVGPLDSRVPAFVPEALGGPNRADLDVQKAAGQMQAAYQKLITGSGGGERELANLEKIGIQLGNEASFRAGFEALKKAYAEKVKDVRSRFRPEVIQRFEAGQRREGVGDSGEVHTTPSGQKLRVFKDGTSEVVE